MSSGEVGMHLEFVVQARQEDEVSASSTSLSDIQHKQHKQNINTIVGYMASP
jgi:hypothetical protein